MGGFHGGHSGGHSGGFHGGSSHHSSYHGGGFRTSVYVGGGRPVHTHRVVNGKHFIDGKRYYGPYYGSRNGKPMTFIGSILIDIFVTALGVLLFCLLFCQRTIATIIHVDSAHDYTGTYCVYDFKYEVRGTEYRGYGEDDDFSFEVGNTYQIYYTAAIPSSYKFESTNTFAFIFGGGVTVLGIFLLISTINVRRKHQQLLEEVGDANGDGVINDADIEYAEKKAAGKAEGAYQGMKDQTYENTRYEERKKIKCPYCDSLLDVNDKFCQNCGASLGK